MDSVRILVADDHEPFRKSVTAFIQKRSHWKVCGEAADGVEAIEKAQELLPHIVLMDVSMPRLDGLQATRAIREKLPSAAIIILSQNDPNVLSRQSAEVGAFSFVTKSNVAQDLVNSIEHAIQARTLIADSESNRLAPEQQNDGEMARLIGEKDWSKTPVGAKEEWSPALKMMVDMLLANRFPLLLWWGSDYVQFYNDAYRPIPGAKHPKSLGQPARECWSEIWHILKPLIDTPFSGGQPTWIEDFELQLHRSKFPEETHFTVAYSPVPDTTAPSGVGGVLATVHEITGKVIGERRLALLRELAARTTEGRTAEDACSIAAETLAKDPKDLPFASLYLSDSQAKCLRLVGTAGVEAGQPASPPSLSLEPPSDTGLAHFAAQASQQNSIVVIENLASHLGTVPRGPWSDPPRNAVVVPIPSSKTGEIRGIVVHGVSSRLELDDNYRTFSHLIAAQIANAISNAEAYEEERRRAEALAEIDRVKTVFFSNVSHEFRTPLTLMLGPLQDLLARSNTHLSPTAKDQLELVNRNGVRLLRLVNTLLDFSRIEAGRIRAVYQATDLAAFTADLASVFRSATDKAGLRLIVDCQDIGEPVYVDRDMWEKIVLNLLSNAFKFTFDGEIRVSVSRVGNTAELRVQDTGVGIPPDAVPRLFERFHRVPNTRSRTHEGSGIGLALVNELIRLHGGSVRVESAVEQGSTFIVSIPLGQDHLPAGQVGGASNMSSTAIGASAFVEEALKWLPDEPSENRVASIPASEGAELVPMPQRAVSDSADRARILVADDNSDMRQYLARLLGEQYEVETVADGQSAINAARQRPPSLILSDVMMPTMDGFELLKAIRADERTRTIPIMLLSARAGEESRIEGLQAGADDYLVKPFSARELVARISARLEIARLQRENEHRVAVDLKAMSRLLEVGNLCVRPETQIEQCLDEFVAAAIDLTGADKGNLQLLDPESGILRIGAQRGFDEPFLKFFEAVRDESSACGTAMGSGKRVDVVDVTESNIFKGHPSLDIMLQAGARAVQSTPLVSGTGNILGMISTYFSRPHRLNDRELRFIELLARQVADYLERKRAERATGLLAAIVASSDDAIVSKNLDGIIQSWNTGAERIFGYIAKEAIGHHITLIIPPDRHAEEDHILACLRRGERIDHFQTVRRRKDGTLIDVSVTISPVRDSSGRVIGASKVARDITAQKQAEQALRESEQRYKVVTDASPVMVWMSGTDKLCYYFNKSWLDFTGHTMEQEVGNGWAQGVHSDDVERCVQLYESCFDARRPFEMEYRLRHHSGQYRWILDCGTPRYAPDGTFEGYVGGCLDIHDRKEAAEKIRLANETMRLMKVQDEERRRIARDLHDSAGQTLTVLGLSLAQLVQNAEHVAPELAKEGRQIEEVVQQLHREIRTTSYLLHPPLLDEAGLTSALDWYVQGVAQRSGMAIELVFSDGFGRLPADMELAIFRVVQECLTNIHRHSESKTAFIRIARENGGVCIEVRDEGKGISPGRMAEIEARGSGVGIAGIRERLRQFGGELKIVSNGSGTLVQAQVPLPDEATVPIQIEPLQATV